MYIRINLYNNKKKHYCRIHIFSRLVHIANKTFFGFKIAHVCCYKQSRRTGFKIRKCFHFLKKNSPSIYIFATWEFKERLSLNKIYVFGIKYQCPKKSHTLHIVRNSIYRNKLYTLCCSDCNKRH